MVRYSRAQALNRPYSPLHSPLPAKNGVNATRLRLPDTMPDGSSGTIAEYLIERFTHVDPAGIVDRFRRSEIVGIAGSPVALEAPLTDHAFIWYYRELPHEQRIPVELILRHRDEHLVVVDKPAFLPTTPGGKYVRESALVRIRTLLGEDHIVPIHRLDRQTSGLLLFSRNPQTRGAYQTMFERRTIVKTYEAVAAYDPRIGFPRQVQSRILKRRGTLRAEEVPGEPNAISFVELLRTIDAPGTPRKALYRLTPRTGKTHQLRLHMARLGIPIMNDLFYPTLQEERKDDYAKPLQLLAKTLSFPDPLTGATRTFKTGLTLSET